MIPILCENNEYIADAEGIAKSISADIIREKNDGPMLVFDEEGLWFSNGDMKIRGDFERLERRAAANKIGGEMLVKACRGRGKSDGLFAVDATAGLGEDSFLLAAAGYRIEMFEYNPVIAALLGDALRRGRASQRVGEIVSRMSLKQGDSLELLKSLDCRPDVIYLDPMFPERSKSGDVKKKFQLIHLIESPCSNEEQLLAAAVSAGAAKIVVKRPAKGPWLAGRKPSYSIAGDSVRYDCLVM